MSVDSGLILECSTVRFGEVAHRAGIEAPAGNRARRLRRNRLQIGIDGHQQRGERPDRCSGGVAASTGDGRAGVRRSNFGLTMLVQTRGCLCVRLVTNRCDWHRRRPSCSRSNDRGGASRDHKATTFHWYSPRGCRTLPARSVPCRPCGRIFTDGIVASEKWNENGHWTAACAKNISGSPPG